MKTDIATMMRELGARAKAAATALACMTAERKHAALSGAAEAGGHRRAGVTAAKGAGRLAMRGRF